VTPSAAARTSWPGLRRHSGRYEASRRRVGQETCEGVTCDPFDQAERSNGSHHRRAGDIRGPEPNCAPLLPLSALLLACAAVITVTSPTRREESPAAGDQPGAALLVGCDVLRFIRAG
jgi:hypothetical protein